MQGKDLAIKLLCWALKLLNLEATQFFEKLSVHFLLYPGLVNTSEYLKNTKASPIKMLL